MHLYNVSMAHEAALAPSAAPSAAASPISFASPSTTALPRLYCRHAPDASTSAALLRQWMQRGVARNASAEANARSRGRVGWLGKDHVAHSRRMDPFEWLYCGVQCLEEGRINASRCQRAWPELRRRSRKS